MASKRGGSNHDQNRRTGAGYDPGRSHPAGLHRNLHHRAHRILSLSYFISAIGMVLSTSFQALGLANYSMILTISRQVVLPLGLALLLVPLGNLNYIWCAYLLAEVIAVPLALALLARTRKTVLDTL